MAVTVVCPGCRTGYPISDDLVGKKIRCKKCQETFTATPAKNRASDDRIQTKPAGVKAGRRNDDAPRGRGRQETKKAGKGLLIGAIVGAIVLIVGGGIGAIALMYGSDTTTDNQQTSAPPVTQPVNTQNANPKSTPQVAKADSAKAQPGTAEVRPADSAVTFQPALNTFAGAVPVAKARPAEFKPETIERAANSAVLIRCDVENSYGYGSGWIAERNGDEALVVTNSHVVFMKEPAKPPPDRIEVILHSGTPQQRSLSDCKLLALDRDEDLAVIRIKGKDLPDALPIAPSYDLQDGQQLRIIGFPHGRFLEQELKRGLGVEIQTTVKKRPTSVAGRIPNKDGSVKYIQVEGGADHGNSGGAVIDTNGNASAVLVAGDPGGNMRWVIPSEYVLHLLHGRVLRLMPGQAVGSGASVKLPIKAHVFDQLKRLAKVTADIWVGKPGNIRPAPASGVPMPVSGDGARVTVQLAYDPNQTVPLGESFSAQGEATLPRLKEGEVYWFQPHYYGKDGKERWAEAVVLDAGRYPVEPKPAHLAIKHKPDQKPEDRRPVALDSRRIFAIAYEELGIGGGYDQTLEAGLTERIRSVNPNTGDAQVNLQYTTLQPKDTDENASFRRQFKGVLEQARNLEVNVTVTKEGRYRNPRPDWVKVSSAARTPEVQRFNQQVIESLEMMALGMPDKNLQPGETWPFETVYSIYTVTPMGGRNTQSALFRMTGKFTGTRVRDGREEAVIELTGQVVRGNNNPNNSGGDAAGGDTPSGNGGSRGQPGGGSENVSDEATQRRGVTGVAIGAAVVDVATGQVILGRIVSDMAVLYPLTLRQNPPAGAPQQQPREVTVTVHAALKTEATLRRSLTKAEPKPVDVTVLLPNQPKAYNPLVGVGTPAMGAESTVSTEPRRPQLQGELYEKARKASVYVRTVRAERITEGSGWFAEPDVVVTSATALGLKDKAARPPEKIEVILEPGQAGERKLVAKLITLDRTGNLAAVRVEGDKLPEPLTVTPSTSLLDTERLTVFGVPIGKQLQGELEHELNARDFQRTIMGRPTAIAGRVPEKDGTVRAIQLEGGADQGNSGGAVVDAKGHVRAVIGEVEAVMEQVGRSGYVNMRWATPGEYAVRLLQGYPLEVKPGTPYLDGSAGKQPIEVEFADPMKRVRKVAIDCWVGTPGNPRKPSEDAPKPVDGDGARQTIALLYDSEKQVGQGEFALPALTPGQVYWLQPRFTNGTGKEQWGRAITYTPDGPPVEKRPVELALKLRRGMKRDVDMTTLARFRYNLLGTERSAGYPLKVGLTETTLKVGQNKSAEMLIEFIDLEFDFKKIFGDDIAEVPQLESMLRDALRPFLSLIKGVSMLVIVNKDGRMTLAPNPFRFSQGIPVALMSQFNEQLFSTLQAMTFPLPGKVVPYGHTWTFDTNLFLNTRRRSEAGAFKMNFKYLGVRDRGGREEAVIEINGTLAHDPTKSVEIKTEDQPGPGNDGKADAKSKGKANPKATGPGSKAPKGLYGLAHGIAHVDVASGTVTHVKMTVDVEAEVSVKDPDTKQDVQAQAGGSIDATLKRTIVAQGR